MRKRVNRLIWTTHALQRLDERGLTKQIANQTFHQPDRVLQGTNDSIEYQKHIRTSLITVIAKQNQQKDWVVLSCWINPPLLGTKDARKRRNYLRYKRASFWGKVGWTILKLLKLVSY